MGSKVGGNILEMLTVAIARPAATRAMPAETAHHVGGTKHFECRVKGHPRPEICWYKDGKEITHVSRYKFDQSQEGVISMVIPDITHEDEGHYRCRAENSEGFASTSAYLVVRGHREHPEEPTTSFHAMQIEESVLFTDIQKAAKKAPRVKDSEPHFETPIEDITGDNLKQMDRNGDCVKERDIYGGNLKEKRLLKEEEEILRKSYQSVVKSSTTVVSSSSSMTTKTTTTTSTLRDKLDKEVAEQESNKIKADMLEKLYHSSDESNDDLDAARHGLKSERSEKKSVKESSGDSISGDESSLLMRQTKRLFSHDYSEESDLFKVVESSTMTEASASRTTTLYSTTETMSAKSRSVTTESASQSIKSSSTESASQSVKSSSTESASQSVKSSSTESASQSVKSSSTESASQSVKSSSTESASQSVKSSSGKTRPELEPLDAVKNAPASLSAADTMHAKNGNVGQSLSLSQIEPAISGNVGAESSVSSMSVSQIAKKTKITAEKDDSGGRLSREMVEEAESLTSREVNSRKVGTAESRIEMFASDQLISGTVVEGESGMSSLAFLQDGSQILESSSRSGNSPLLTGESEEPETWSLAQSGAATKVMSDVEVKESSEEHDDDNERFDAATKSEEESTRFRIQDTSFKHTGIATGSKKAVEETEQEDNDSVSESDGGSSVGSVVGIDVDLADVHRHKMQKQESKEKDDAEEEARLTVLATSARKSAEVRDEVGAEIGDRKTDIEDEKQEDEIRSKRSFLESLQISEAQDGVDEKKVDFGESRELKTCVVVDVVEVDDQKKVDVKDEKESDAKTKHAVDDIKEVGRHAEDGGKRVGRHAEDGKEVEVLDKGTKFVGKEKEDRDDEKDRDDDKNQDFRDGRGRNDGRDLGGVDARKKGQTENEASLRREEQDDDAEETVVQRVSWIEKVVEEKEHDKEEIDGTAKGGDKENESPPSKPRIIQRMENTTMESGQTLTLRTQVQATPRPDVTWSKDGRTLRQRDRMTLAMEDDVYSLEIYQVDDSDSGIYRLRAVNSEGEVFTDVIVSVISVAQSTLAPGDRELSLTATVGVPQFLVQPQDVSVAESETIKLTCTVAGEPAPKVSWEKDGQLVKSNRRVRVYESRGVYNLEIRDCEPADSGQYICTAVNGRGQVTASVNVFIEGVESVMSTSEPAEPSGAYAGSAEEVLVGATGGGTESSSDELFLKSYLVLMDYTDRDTQTSFQEGELVEVLDSRQKSGMWLVRGKLEKNKVCFVPSSLLCDPANGSAPGRKEEQDTDEGEISQKKRERKSNHSPKFGSAEVDIDTSEDELRLRTVHPDYEAVADYKPPAGDTNSVRLSEGQIVEVIDMERPDLWLIKTRPSKTSPSRQGWVPSAYLEEKSASSQLMSRSTRETFREEVLQVTNKQQEASLKRRYIIKELEETEREYVRDLKMVVESFVGPITAQQIDVPPFVTASAGVVFSNIADILKFHDSQFLSDISECCARPSSIGSVFLKWKSEFDNYIEFLGDRDMASFLLESEDMKAFFKVFSKRSSVPESAISSLLKKPMDRLQAYQLLLRGVLRYTARSKEDCGQVEEAIAMLIAIEKAVGNNKLLPLLEGFDTDTTDLSKLLRHDDFCVWDGDVGSSRGKDRHVFLFADKIVMAKKKKPELSTDPACFSLKTSVDLVNVRVKESGVDEDRRFELWFIGDSAVEKVTLQSRSGSATQAWVKDIREALVKLGVSETDRIPETITEQIEEDDVQSGSATSVQELSPTPAAGENPCLISDSHRDHLQQDNTETKSRDSDRSFVAATEEEEAQHKPFLKHLLKNIVCNALVDVRFVEQLSDDPGKYGTEGSLARVEVSVGGNPAPSVSWQKGDKPIKEGEGIKIISEGETSCLIFSRVNKSSSGTYTVTVSNSHGSSSSSFDLVVIEDLVETDTSTDRTNGEVGDSESDSETIVDEAEEAPLSVKFGIRQRKEVVEENKLEEERVEEKPGLLKDENKERQRGKKEEESENKQQGVWEEEIVSSKRVEVKKGTAARASEKEEFEGFSEEPDSVRWQGQGQVNSVEEAVFSSTDSRTFSKSLIQEEQGEDWALRVVSEVGETSGYQSATQSLTVRSQTLIDSSDLVGSEVTQHSLSFETDISNSKNVENILDLRTLGETEQSQSLCEALSLQSEASVESSTFKRTQIQHHLLSFETDISNSESVESAADLHSSEKREDEQSISEGLSLQTDAYLDSSAYRKTEVSQNLLSFETDISNPKSVESIFDLTSPGDRTSKVPIKDTQAEAILDRTSKVPTEDTQAEATLDKTSKVPTEDTHAEATLDKTSKVPTEDTQAEATLDKTSKVPTEDTQAEATLDRTSKVPTEDTQAEATFDRTSKVPTKDTQTEATFDRTSKVPTEDTQAEATLDRTSKVPTEDTQAEATFDRTSKVPTKDTQTEATFDRTSKVPTEDTQAEATLDRTSKVPTEDTQAEATFDRTSKVPKEDTQTEATFDRTSKVPKEDTQAEATLDRTSKVPKEDTQANATFDRTSKVPKEDTQTEATFDRISKVPKEDTQTESTFDRTSKVPKEDTQTEATFNKIFKVPKEDTQTEATFDRISKVPKVDTQAEATFDSTSKVPKEDTQTEATFDKTSKVPKEDTQTEATFDRTSKVPKEDIQADATFDRTSKVPKEDTQAEATFDKTSKVPKEDTQAESTFDRTSKVPKEDTQTEATFDRTSKVRKEDTQAESTFDRTSKVPTEDTQAEAIFDRTLSTEDTQTFDTQSRTKDPETAIEAASRAERFFGNKVEEKREEREEVQNKEENSAGFKEEKPLQRERKTEKTKPEKDLAEETREEKDKTTHKALAPTFVGTMDDCVTELGDLARFDCRVSAYPDPEITWYKDGNKVTPSTKYELLNFHDDIFSLLIKKVDPADSGCYTCVAKNDYGEAKSRALLNVMGLKEKVTDAHVAPSFVTKFYDMEVVEGLPVEFVCMIDGNPDPVVTWLLNGQEVQNSCEILTRRQDDTVMLAFRSIKMENAGEIICKLKNDSGQAMCKARLKVKEDLSKRGERPLFLEQPSDKEVSEGDEVTFECVISGIPEPEITWYFNGREVHKSRNRTMRQKPGQKYILTIREVIPEYAGVYTCKAVNLAGDASCAVELSVKELLDQQPLKGKYYDGNIAYDSAKYAFPPSFTRRIQDQKSLPGRMARFEAMMIGVPEPQVEWQKDGFPIKWGPKYKTGLEGNTAILIVDNCDSADEGTYTCNIFNDAGKAASSAQLKIQDERLRQSIPRFMSPAKGVDLYRASPALTPKKPTPREIPLEDKIPTIPIDKPVLLDVKPNSAKLSWMPAPTARLPENAQKITYTIEARQLPSTQWVRLDSNIEATTHYVYGLNPDTEYIFRVRAENRFGTSEPTLPCTLKPREEPKGRQSLLRETETPVRPVLPKARPYVSDIGKETIQIGWKPAEIPGYIGRSMSVPPVTYRVEAQKLPSEEWVPLASRVKKPSIYLSDLESNRDYNIRIRAQTPYGVSQPTEPVWIPRAKVSRPTITEIEEGTARLQWNRVDIPAFDTSDEPLLYMIEVQEPPSYRWRELARRIPTNHYIVRDLEPAQDYYFRVRAESRDGLLSEPSPATSLFRTLALSRAPVDRLEIEEYDADLQSARLSWRRVEVPPYGDQESPLLYMIECETPGQDGWRPLVSGIPTTRYRVPDVSPTQDYRFRVRALSPYGVSPPSYPTELYSRRPSPMRPLAQDLHISNLEPEGLRLSWRSASVPPVKSAEPVSYQIEALEYPKQEWRPLATNIRDNSYRLGGLKPASDYSFRVRAQTPSGLAEPTAPVTLTSLPVRPRLPVREPTISELGSDSVRLQWKPAELPYYSRHITPISYTVDYQEIPGRDWVVAARRIPDTSYTVRGLRGDRDYRFRICPETEYGPGEYSLPVHIHRRTVPNLSSREPLISNISPTSATLSWHPATLTSGAPSRPITYRVEGREPPSSSWYDVAGRLSSTSHSLQFLYPDQDYMFRVIADYDGAESEPTMAVYLPHRAGPPKMSRDPPFVSSVQPESVILAWRSVELPSRITDYSPVTYRIEILEGPSSDWRPLARQINQTHFHATKLRPDMDYSFRVRAENEFGVSDPTDPIVVRKRSVAPFMSQHEPLISDVRKDSLRLTWQPAEMPSYLTDSVPVTYTVSMQEDGDHSWQPIARRVAGTSYYVTGLSPDQDYSFRIHAENNFGTSLPSFPSRLHRKLKGPIYSPIIEDVETNSFRLSWKQPALSKPTTYSIETLEPSTWKWRPLVSRLPHPSFRVTGIQPTTDYAFRVRAEVDSVVSDPSLPISFSRRRAGERAMSEQPPSRMALPTVPIERPTLSEVYEDSVRINWHPTFYHGSSRKHLPEAYRLEVREPPDTNWHTLVPRTDAWSYEVTDLKPNQDYAFRVRTVSDMGMSEPSLPISLYRQAATPRVPLPSPEISDIGDDYIGLRWKLVDIPAFDMDETPLSFMVEAQTVPDYNWRPVARGVTGSSHKVTGLEPSHDYRFRLRGETSAGLTQPSVTLPVYRKPVSTGVPITNLRIDSDSNQPYSARLNWNPVYMPPYSSNVNLSYTVEAQEPPRSEWYPLARDILATSYTASDLSPLKDYLFRVKARPIGGEYSAPTQPVPYYRSPVSSSWERTHPPHTTQSDEYAPIARPYIEGLILKVPPRMSIEKPDMMVISPECVSLTWKAARVPSATSSLSPTTYRVEVRHEDSFEWIEKATGIKGLNTEIRGLNPYIDYAFRVRAVNDFGWSESTLPAFLHRPQDLRDAGAAMEFEQFETYGSMLSDISVPRMPMDTPRMGLIQDRSMSLSWTPARIPAYARKTPITYIVEKKEPADRDWMPLVSRIPDTSYTIRSIEPKQDYLFRIRAENEHGLSEATLPAVLTRSKAPQFIRSSSSRERELDSSSRRSSYSYIDSISAGVPPRVPAGRPSISDISDTALTLSWQPGRMPSYIKGPVKISYIIESRQPPNHMWSKVCESVPGTSYKLTGLRLDQDYMFRVRAYNDSGMSEPTLPVTLTHAKTQAGEPRTLRKRSSVERFSSTERYASKERSMSLDRGSSLPRIYSRDTTRREEEEILVGKTPDTTSATPEFVPSGSPGVQYAIGDQPARISLQIRGFPLPTVDWYFKGKKLPYGDKYDGYITLDGLAVLQFASLTWDDVGEYKCVAENEQGQATFAVILHITDPPTFLVPIRDLQLKSQGRGQFTCRVDGIPSPTVKFLKDWKPLAESSRFKVTQDGVDQWSLHIEQASPSAAGCYVCVAENAAGKVFSTARLSVDDDIPTDSLYYKKTNFEDNYYVLEELGRGRYSTVRRVIERITGREYAAKFTKVRDEAEKDFFRFELDALIRQTSPHVQKLHDAYESPHQLILVVDIIRDSDLLDRVVGDSNWTESRAAYLVKLILLALRDVHSSGFLHLDLKPTNIRFSSPDDSSLQLIDFGFSRRLPVTNDLRFNYGTPEFCSPESVSNEFVTQASDLWAVGVVTHLLLTGVSPFWAETTPEILSQVQQCQWSPDGQLFSDVTDSARDFLSRILVQAPSDRLSLEACLAHDWLKVTEKVGTPNLDLSRLKAFQARTKAQQKASAVKTVGSLVSLKRLLEGPLPLTGLQPTTDPRTGEVILPDTEEYGQFLDEESWYDWQSRHQQGIKADVSSSKPQVKGHKRGSVDNLVGDSADEVPSQDQQKTRSKQLLSEADRAEIPPSLEKELEWLEETRKQGKPRDVDEISLASKRSSLASVTTEGFPGPIFKEKLHNLAFSEGNNVILRCVIVGPPSPTVVWYKNEELLAEGTRLKISLEEDGEAILTIKNAKSYDAGIYKCVGRNKFGRASNKMRLQLADVPGRPGQPAVAQVSSSDALVLWEAPRSDGNSDILFYKLDYKAAGGDRWLTATYTTQEAAVVTGLKPSTFYRYRVSTTNRFGTSPYSWASADISTISEDYPAIVSDNFFDVAKLKAAQTSTRPTLPSEMDDIIHEGEVTEEESEPKLKASSLESVYNIGDTLYRGKFYEEKSLTLPSDNDKKFLLRTVSARAGQAEFDILKSLRHERLIRLFDAFSTTDHVYLILECAEGEHIASHLSQRRKYTENTVASVVRQILFGLEFLQRVSIVHLNLQPASVVVSKLEGCEIKITDFSLARKVSGPEGDIVPRRGFADFISPEVLVKDQAGFAADIWGVGTLTFLLLSGISPFRGDSYESTLVNITLNRYEAVDLYENITVDALKFLFKVLKRLPRNRPSLQDCLDHKWLQLSDQATKHREEAIFLSNTLATFVQDYDRIRQTDNFRQTFEDDQLPVQMSTERSNGDRQV